MCTWQNACFRNNRTNLVDRTTVYATAFLHDGATHDVAFNFFTDCLEQRTVHTVWVGFGANQSCFGTLLCGTNGVLTRTLVSNAVSSVDLGTDHVLDGLVFGAVIFSLEVPRIFRGLLCQRDDQVDHRLHLLVREGNPAQHHFFGQFVDL